MQAKASFCLTKASARERPVKANIVACDVGLDFCKKIPEKKKISGIKRIFG